VLKDKFS